MLHDEFDHLRHTLRTAYAGATELETLRSARLASRHSCHSSPEPHLIVLSDLILPHTTCREI